MATVSDWGLVAIVLLVVSPFVFLVGWACGAREGRSDLCKEQLSGMYAEGKCFRSDSLRLVAP